MDNALGAIIGALVGDAAGAPLEFKRRYGNDDIEDAIMMRGGGSLCVGPGQVTDDGELTMALAGALSGAGAKDGFPINRVGEAYNAWYMSDPFDCGMTCRRAFHDSEPSGICVGMGERMLARATRHNMASEANGAMMRATPIPIWCYNEPCDVVAQYARLDCSLSHPSQVCQECNAVYCVAIYYLLRNGGKELPAIDGTTDYVEYFVHTPTVKRWFAEDRHSYFSDMNQAAMHIGHVKHAFCMAMNFLHAPPPTFEHGIRQVLAAGGDTDTNAAICGGILGAMFGFHGIPAYMKDPVLECQLVHDPKTLLGHNRPTSYRAKNAVSFVRQVFV